MEELHHRLIKVGLDALAVDFGYALAGGYAIQAHSRIGPILVADSESDRRRRPPPGLVPGRGRCGGRCAGQTWLLISPATRSPEATAALRVMLSTSVCSPAKWMRPSWTAS